MARTISDRHLVAQVTQGLFGEALVVVRERLDVIDPPVLLASANDAHSSPRPGTRASSSRLAVLRFTLCSAVPNLLVVFRR